MATPMKQSEIVRIAATEFMDLNHLFAMGITPASSYTLACTALNGEASSEVSARTRAIFDYFQDEGPLEKRRMLYAMAMLFEAHLLEDEDL